MFIDSRPGRAARGAMALSLVCLAMGCAGTLDDPERFIDGSAQVSPGPGPASTACGDVPTSLFAKRCASAGCHDATTSTAGLDLASPDLEARVKGKSATGGPGMLLDAEGDPQKSVIYLKVTATPPFGSRMPLGAALTDADIACVSAWVTSTGTASNPSPPADDAGAVLGGGDTKPIDAAMDAHAP